MDSVSLRFGHDGKLLKLFRYITSCWGCFRCICILHTVGILYVLGVGLRSQKAPSSDAVQIYGIDQVSGYYGPGSWASWLLTTTACCVDRLFRKPDTGHLGASHRRLFPGIDLNIVGIYSYAIIAGFDLLFTMTHVDKQVRQIECLAASHAVVRIGTGFGIILAIICSGRWYQHDTEPAAAIFSVAGAVTLFIMSSIVDDILFKIGVEDSALTFLSLANSGYRSLGGTECARVLEDSGLIYTHNEHNFHPVEVMLFVHRGSRYILRCCLYPTAAYTGWSVLSRDRQRKRPFMPFGLITTILRSFTIFLMLDIYLAYLLPAYLWSIEAPPMTLASILDLDQLSLLILGGALVVVSIGMRSVEDWFWDWESLRRYPQYLIAHLMGINDMLRVITRRQATHVETGTPFPPLHPRSQEEATVEQSRPDSD